MENDVWWTFCLLMFLFGCFGWFLKYCLKFVGIYGIPLWLIRLVEKNSNTASKLCKLDCFLLDGELVASFAWRICLK